MKTFCKIELDLFNNTFVNPLTKKQKDYIYNLVAINLDNFNYYTIDQSEIKHFQINQTESITFKFYHKRNGIRPVLSHDMIISIHIDSDYIDLLTKKTNLSAFVRKTKMNKLLQDD